jgi:hypothetical protein
MNAVSQTVLARTLVALLAGVMAFVIWVVAWSAYHLGKIPTWRRLVIHIGLALTILGVIVFQTFMLNVLDPADAHGKFFDILIIVEPFVGAGWLFLALLRQRGKSNRIHVASR